MRTWAVRRLKESAGQYAASAAVVAVVAAFAVLLLEAIDVLHRAVAVAKADGGATAGGATAVALGSFGAVFLGIAVLTAAVVVTNPFPTVYAGRLREIALLRLV